MECGSVGHLLREWDIGLDVSTEFESPEMCSGTYPLVKRYFTKNFLLPQASTFTGFIPTNDPTGQIRGFAYYRCNLT